MKKKKSKSKKKIKEMLSLTCSACGNVFRKKRESFIGVTLKGPCPKCKSFRVRITKRHQGHDEDGRIWD